MKNEKLENRLFQKCLLSSDIHLMHFMSLPFCLLFHHAFLLPFSNPYHSITLKYSYLSIISLLHLCIRMSYSPHHTSDTLMTLYFCHSVFINVSSPYVPISPIIPFSYTSSYHSYTSYIPLCQASVSSSLQMQHEN